MDDVFVQLAANSRPNGIPNESIRLRQIRFERFTNTIPHSCDIWQPQYFYFCHDDLNVVEFKNIIKDKICTVSANGQQIVEYHFNLLIELNPILKRRNSFLVKIPSFLLPPVRSIMSPFTQFQLQFADDTQYNFIRRNFDEYGILNKCTYLDNETRTTLIRRIDETSAWDIDTVQMIKNFEFRTYSTRGSMDIHIDSLQKGFFIHGPLENINNISIMCNYQPLFEWNNIILSACAHMISDNVFYLSFQGDNNYTSTLPSSFVGSVSFSQFYNIRLNLELFESNNSCYNMYFIGCDSLGYRYGQTSLVGTPIFTSNNEIRRTSRPSTTLSTSRPSTSPRLSEPITGVLTMSNVSLDSSSSFIVANGVRVIEQTIPTSSLQTDNLIHGTLPFSFTSSSSQVTNNQHIVVWRDEIRHMNDEIVCSISHEIITNEYAMCNLCNNSFSFDAINTWLAQNDTCPLCRSVWTNYVKYINN